MIRYEYRSVPAPRRENRYPGVESGEAAFARTIEDALNAEAAAGWEFQRAEALPCDVRKGALRARVEELHTVLIFRRPVQAADAPGERTRDRAGTQREPEAPPGHGPDDAPRGPEETRPAAQMQAARMQAEQEHAERTHAGQMQAGQMQAGPPQDAPAQQRAPEG